MNRDYVVAIHLQTHETQVWLGTQFRPLDSTVWHQYQISMALHKAEAIARAQRVQQELLSGVAVTVGYEEKRASSTRPLNKYLGGSALAESGFPNPPT